MNASDAIQFLHTLIAVPSISREEDAAAGVVFDFLQKRDLAPKRHLNNVYAFCRHYSPEKKTLLLCSHIDTVRPAAGYCCDPFVPVIVDGRLYGLGSNDAGASVASLIACFAAFYDRPLSFNLVLALVAEEEVQGKNGISALLPLLGKIDCAVVGEPTQMNAAIGERGLMVLDCTARGQSGHAARNEGKNALYIALDDIAWLRNFDFPKVSERMGKVKLTATMIQCGSQHNVVPDECRFVVDVRSTDVYSNEEIADIMRQNMQSEIVPRSLHLRASGIADTHPLTQAARRIGCETYVSPTTSDIVILNGKYGIPSLKMGAGNSARSHTANEFVFISEIEDGVTKYRQLIEALEM